MAFPRAIALGVIIRGIIVPDGEGALTAERIARDGAAGLRAELDARGQWCWGR